VKASITHNISNEKIYQRTCAPAGHAVQYFALILFPAISLSTSTCREVNRWRSRVDETIIKWDDILQISAKFTASCCSICFPSSFKQQHSIVLPLMHRYICNPLHLNWKLMHFRMSSRWSDPCKPLCLGMCFGMWLGMCLGCVWVCVWVCGWVYGRVCGWVYVLDRV
jgi:hypothetical protein